MAKVLLEDIQSRLNIPNITDITSVKVQRKFGRPEDYVEIYITNFAGGILDHIPDYKGYTTPTSITAGLADEINIDPLNILKERGYSTGTYKVNVNIQKRKIYNSLSAPFTIEEISPSRTELKIATNRSNSSLERNSRGFINSVRNSPFFKDFTLSFPENNNFVAVNIDLDRSNPNKTLLLVKLLNPIPESYEKGNKLQIVEDIVEPISITYDLGELEPEDTSIPLRGPNFNIDLRLNETVPTAFKSYNDILQAETTSSYQRLLSKLKNYDIPEIDYGYVRPVDTASLDFEQVTPSHFENFVHFGSATERLKNFEYKLKLLEIYENQFSGINTISGSTSQSAAVLQATASIVSKKRKLIEGFDGYEQFLYFDSGSKYSWPKTNSEEPYLLASTTSDQARIWLGSNNSFDTTYYGGQLLSASVFDNQNPNRLIKVVPNHIEDKEDNNPYLLFCDMIGNFFDPIWAHIKEISEIRDNKQKLGVSKNLVYYALKTIGIETFDQFENQDLINYVFGKVTTTKDKATVITGSNSIISKEDITKEVWKRIYNNAPYLLKTKGTERGLRALINCYGIPDTMLDIKEYGSANPNRDDFKTYSYSKFSKILSGYSADHEGFFVQTDWSSSLTQDLSASAKTVEFRIKPGRLLGKDGKATKQHLFSLSGSISSSDVHLILTPYTGSSDFFDENDRTQYGKIELHQFTSSIATSSGFLPNNNTGLGLIELVDLNEPLSNYGATITSATSLDFASNTSGGPQYVSNITSEDLISGKIYKISATVSKYAGTGNVGFSNSGGVSGTARRSTNGLIEEIFTSTGGQPDIFIANGVTAATLSDISVKEMDKNQYFPVYNGNFWNVFLGTDGASGSDATVKFGAYQANHLQEVSSFTSSLTISEQKNAEVFGNPKYRPNLVENGSYDDTSAWHLNSIGSGWSISNGRASYNNLGTASEIRQILTGSGGLTPNTFYEIKFDLFNVHQGNVAIALGGSGFDFIPSSSNGGPIAPCVNTTGNTVTHIISTPSNLNPNQLLQFRATTNFSGSIDNLRVRPLHPQHHNGASKAFFGGIRNFGNPLTSSNYFGGPPTTQNTGSAFNLEYSGSISEIRYYFGELLNHKTLKNHALEPLMYAGNTISSSFNYCVLRYPLSFELALSHDTTSQLASSSAVWNTDPTDSGLVSPTSPLVGPITGGAIMTASLNQADFPDEPIFTIAGIPLLRSHHPNEDKDYLDGFSLLGVDNIVPYVEDHHLPTPNTIGRSPMNRKIRIDEGKVQDNILSPIILSQEPTANRQVPDFDAVGVFFSPQNEMSEDIIYTLGTFSLDERLGDPRHSTSSYYPDFRELKDTYFNKLEKGSKKQNVFDFVRTIQFIDHTLFEMVKQFVPQKANLKTGLLIEPHYLERTKFKRHHPVPTNTFVYNANLSEVTQSFHKNNNISQLNFTSGSAVISTNSNIARSKTILKENFDNGDFGFIPASNYIPKDELFSLFLGGESEELIRNPKFLSTDPHDFPGFREENTPVLGIEPAVYSKIPNGFRFDILSQPNFNYEVRLRQKLTNSDGTPSSANGFPALNKSLQVGKFYKLSFEAKTNAGTLASQVHLGVIRKSNGTDRNVSPFSVSSEIQTPSNGSTLLNETTFTKIESIFECQFVSSQELQFYLQLGTAALVGKFLEVRNISLVEVPSAIVSKSGNVLTLDNPHVNINESKDLRIVNNQSGNNLMGTVSEPITLVKGKKYKVSFNVKVNSGELRYKIANRKQDYLGTHLNNTTVTIATDTGGYQKRDSGNPFTPGNTGTGFFFENVFTVKQQTKTMFVTFFGPNGLDAQVDNLLVEELNDNNRYFESDNGRPLQTGFNSTILIDKLVKGKHAWEQGPIIPNSTGSNITSSRNSSNSNELNNNALVTYGNYTNQKVSKKFKRNLIQHNNLRLVDSSKNNLLTQFNFGTNVSGTENTLIFSSTGNAHKANVNLGNYKPKIGRRYRLKYTISNYSAGAIKPRIMTEDGHYFEFTQRAANGTFIETGTILGKLQQNFYNRFWFMAVGTTTLTISNITLEEINPLRDTEFNDSLIDMSGWKNSRHAGSRLKGAKINEYTVGDVTYGLNPVAKRKSAALYFGKSIIGADGEDEGLVTIKNHSYIDIEKIMIIDKHKDEVTTINVTTEDYKGINAYLEKDFGGGKKFSVKILDGKISHKLQNEYTSKFSQGYLYKVIEHKGINGGGSTSGDGIQVGFVDVSTAPFPYTRTNGVITQSVFCYGNDSSTMNSNTLILKENPLTNKIFPSEDTFGKVDFVSSSNNFVNSTMQNLGCFINSMLIPIASESNFRLFGTFNDGQQLTVADYNTGSNDGIQSISTVEFDIDGKFQNNSGSYVVSSSGLHTLISASSDMKGFGRDLLHPDHYVIPIKFGAHDVIRDKKPGAGITWPGNGGNTGASRNSGATNIQLQFFFSGDGHLNSKYQISYLEEKQAIIANIDKSFELANDTGENGYILIPSNLDDDIRANLDYFLDLAGMGGDTGDTPERIPNKKE